MTWAQLDDLVEERLSPAQKEAWRACRAPGSMPVREFARVTDRSPGTVGNHLSRAEEKLTDALEEYNLPLDFLAERDDQTGSWRRAVEDGGDADVTRKSKFGWRVEMPDGSPHTVALGKERGGYVGWCDCRGFEYRDAETSPCAHLCVLRQSEVVAPESIDEPELSIPDTEADSGDRAVTDGGEVVEHAAGADGRTFGRPEGKL